jgi:hypothetical protein
MKSTLRVEEAVEGVPTEGSKLSFRDGWDTWKGVDLVRIEMAGHWFDEVLETVAEVVLGEDYEMAAMLNSTMVVVGAEEEEEVQHMELPRRNLHDGQWNQELEAADPAEARVGDHLHCSPRL